MTLERWLSQFRFRRSIGATLLFFIVLVSIVILLGYICLFVYFETPQVWPRDTLVALLLLVEVGLALIWLAIEYLLIRPLRTLNDNAARLNSGDLSISSSLTYTPDEFGQLSQHMEQLSKVMIENARNIREAERYFQVMAESTGVALLVYRGDRIIYANHAAETLTGYSSEDLVGMHGDYMFEVEVLDEIRQFVVARLREFTLESAPLPSERNHVSAHITTKQGASRQVDLVAGITIYDGKPAILITLNDVTDRQAAEEARVAQQVAEKASKAKSELLARVSHELRTPLTSILGYAQFLQLDDLTEAQQDSLRRIERSSRHLLSLINEVLDLTSLEANRFTLVPTQFSLERLVSECVEMFIPITQTKGVEIEVKGLNSQSVLADPKRLKQILVNLISNSVKYSPKGNKVGICVACQGDGMVTIRVCNHGPAIPVEHRDRLFQPFERLSNLEEGTGLGLALSKRLVEAMGGNLILEKSDQESTVFSLSIPIHSPTTFPPHPLHEVAL